MAKKFKKFKKSKIEIVLQFIKGLARKLPCINETENEILSEEFSDVVIAIKEQNSQHVYNAYYLPKAINAILKEENYLTTESGAKHRAKAMLLADMANGVLDEFYRFTK